MVSAVCLRARGRSIERRLSSLEPEFLGRGLSLPQIIAQRPAPLPPKTSTKRGAGKSIHGGKRDAPSGTLLAVAEEMKQAGFERAINLSANRAGAHPGTHEIGFDSGADSITIRHTARSREGFARGALRAARWILGKTGVFEFREIVNELG